VSGVVTIRVFSSLPALKVLATTIFVELLLIMKIMSLSTIGRSFASRNYQLFFLGQGLSLLGNWITKTTILWLAYDLTHSPLFLGIIGFLSQIPNLLVTPFAGVIIERHQRRRVLIFTHVLSVFIFLGLGLLCLEGLMNSWLLVGLSIAQGIINSVVLPARQTFLGDIVQKEDISNATALHSSLATICRILGPSIAGFLIVMVDVSYCFFLDALSYVAVITVLIMIHINPEQQTPLSPKAVGEPFIFRNLREGGVYVWEFLPIRLILLQIAAMSFLGMPYRSLLPIWATEIIKGDATTLGYLMAATGIGALGAALYLSNQPSVVGFAELVTFSPAVFGVALVAFCFVDSWLFSLLLMAIVGASSLLVSSASNALLQTIADVDKRARVMSFYTMAMMGILPLGELFMGSLTQEIGITYTLMISGTSCIALAILSAINLPNLQEVIRPIYIKNGLLSG
jgi:MFS family permease